MMNTPRVCMVETKKAFRKLSKDDMVGAVQALCNMKGVGPQMASGESYCKGTFLFVVNLSLGYTLFNSRRIQQLLIVT